MNKIPDKNISKFIDKSIENLKIKLNSLLSSPKYSVIDVKKNRYQHNVKGVYLISCNAETVYGGKTRSGTIGSRIKDHLSISESSDLNQIIKRHTEYPQELNQYEVQYIKEDDNRKRGLLEDFVISVLNPPFNRVEN